MEFRLVLFALVLFALSGSSYSQVVDTPYVIGTWRGFVPGAVSYTFDDNCSNQLAVAVPMFDAKGFKLTLFTIILWQQYPVNWSKLQAAAKKGHEIACHTMTHADFKVATNATQNYELKNSRDSINKYIPGKQCITVAYPYCNEGVDSICTKYYIAGRTCSGQVVPKTPSNFFAISSYICGSQGSATTTTALNTLADNAANQKGWCVYLFHSIENDGGYSPISTAALQGNVDYMSTNTGRFWVETFGNVTRYIKERDAASVHGVSVRADSITLNVTDGLNDTVYNYPISIRRKLPAGWQTVFVSQGDTLVSSHTKDSLGSKYVFFDVVPDGGNVVIFRNTTGVSSTSGLSNPDGYDAHIVANNLVVSGSSLSPGSKMVVDLYDLKGSLLVHRVLQTKNRDNWSIALPENGVRRGMEIVSVTCGTSVWSKRCIR